MTGAYRIVKVEHLIHKEVAYALASRVNAPGAESVTVLWVKVSKDLSFADVYVSIMGDEETVARGLQALGRCRGYVQQLVAGRIRLRKTPYIRFRLDRQYRSALRIYEILKELEADGLSRGDEDSGST